MSGTGKQINQSQAHWDLVYGTNDPSRVSWFQSRPDLSLELISQAGTSASDDIIDVGGGASTLADHLLIAGYSRLTVLDISPIAIDSVKKRLGSRASSIEWKTGDMLTTPLDRRRYGLWHDRAVFHFLADPANRRRYGDQLRHALRPGGHAIIATFAEDGPLRCSGLDVCRYSAGGLLAELGDGLALLDQRRENHQTPVGGFQKFIYCLFRRTE
jgi:SAM-dependent methyltransferase